ncbi:MAG TPA: tetratricopeptide repeat protein [Saprospiraceae bacterium]|nr:tetratricopeptide repeat protein [Saprospiraceae bacterium]
MIFQSNYILSFVTLMIFWCSLKAQEVSSVPLIKGNVTISIADGEMICDFEIQDIPPLEDYEIFINAGLNIKQFWDLETGKALSYRRNYNPLYSYEAFNYHFPDSEGSGKYLPNKIKVQYTGKFPVIDDISKASEWGDWKGNIAFNHMSVRADGLQTAWYPILYDVKAEYQYSEVRYDITISCADCTAIYLNGSNPYKGSIANFSSEVPVEIFLMAGIYDFIDQNGLIALNTFLDENELKVVDDKMQTIMNYYESYTGIPYGGKMVLVQNTPVSQLNSWFFVSFPSLVSITHNRENGLERLTDPLSPLWGTMAHEAAHYYFSTSKFNSGIDLILTEGFAEYMSLKASISMLGIDFYREKIVEKLKSIGKFEPQPLSSLKTRLDYKPQNDRYVYHYMPLLLIAIEMYIGEEAMWLWINRLLTEPFSQSNFEFVFTCLERVISNPVLADQIKNNFLESEQSWLNIQSTLLRLPEYLYTNHPSAALEMEAAMLRAMGQFENAINAYEKLLDISTVENKHQIYFDMGSSAIESGDHALSCDYFEKACISKPEFYQAAYQYARSAIISKTNLDKAVEMLEHYISTGPHEGYIGEEAAWWRLGNIYELKENTTKALNCYNKALKINPEHEETLKSLHALSQKE